MAAGPRISRPFLCGSPSRREGSERQLGASAILTAATSRRRVGAGRGWGVAERHPSGLSPPERPHWSSGRSAGLRPPQPSSPRVHQPRRGVRTAGPCSHRRSRPLLAAGLALPPPGKPAADPRAVRSRHLAPGLAAYLGSSPRRAPGRPRPRGDIRAPGSDSGPHLQAPAAAGLAPRPATRGGSAERRRCPGSRPPLRSVRPSPGPREWTLVPRRAQASCSGLEKRECRGMKGDYGAVPPARRLSARAARAGVTRGPSSTLGREAPAGHQGFRTATPFL